MRAVGRAVGDGWWRFVAHESGPVWFLVLSGLAIRVLVMLSANGIIWPDSMGYYADALNVRDGRIFSSHLMFRTPLYPAFWSLFLHMGDNPVSGMIMIGVQHLLGLLSVILIYRVTRDVFGPAAAFLTALLFSFHALLLFYECVVLTEILFVFLLSASVYVFHRALQEGRSWRWVEFGVLVALLTLTRPIGELLLPALLPLVWLKHRSLTRFGAAVAITGLSTFLLLCPWMISNARVYGFFGVAQLKGVYLFHKAFDKAWIAPPGSTRFPDVERGFRAQRALQDERKIRIDWSVWRWMQKQEGVRAAEADRRMLGFALEAIRQDPASFIAQTAEDFALFFWHAKNSICVRQSETGPYLGSMFGKRYSTPAFPRRPVTRFRAVREILSPCFRHGQIPMKVVIPAAVAGMILFFLREKKRWAEGVIYVIIPISLAFFTALFETYQDRYRLPADPFLFAFAAYAVVTAAQWAMGRSRVSGS
jgi:4-amino-4-deoxy-L-arabinose transferase-like glycosyltransferase